MRVRVTGTYLLFSRLVLDEITSPEAGRVMAASFTPKIIERARFLIADRKHWCRFVLARDEAGVRATPTDPKARKYCAIGALIAAASEVTSDPGQAEALGRVAANVVAPRGGWSLVIANDFGGHAAVLSLFEKAMAQEDKEGHVEQPALPKPRLS